jgi:hypothetical protein
MKRLVQLFTEIILVLLVSFIAISCKKKITNRADLIGYINDPDNGLVKTEEIGKIKAQMLYKPWQLMVQASDAKNKLISNKYSANQLKNKYFFVLSLSANNKELLRQLPFSQYSETVQVLAFRMNESVEITPDKMKPVKPLECIFQQTYGMGAANNLLIVFNNKTLTNTDDLKIKIREFGLNTGDLNFKIKTKHIKDIQNIELN